MENAPRVSLRVVDPLPKPSISEEYTTKTRNLDIGVSREAKSTVAIRHLHKGERYEDPFVA